MSNMILLGMDSNHHVFEIVVVEAKARLRCKDCLGYRYYLVELGFKRCVIFGKRVNSGWLACRKFEYRVEKGEDDGDGKPC